MQLELAKRAGSSSMDDSLGDPLVVKVRDLFSVVKVFQEGGTAGTGLESVVRVLGLARCRALERRTHGNLGAPVGRQGSLVVSLQAEGLQLTLLGIANGSVHGCGLAGGGEGD